jgi:hypothetical protein
VLRVEPDFAHGVLCAHLSDQIEKPSCLHLKSPPRRYVVPHCGFTLNDISETWYFAKVNLSNRKRLVAYFNKHKHGVQIMG